MTGRDAKRGGYSRPVYSSAEITLREWFIAEAQARGLEVSTDANGIIWAWWDLPGSRQGRGLPPRRPGHRLPPGLGARRRRL